MRSQQLELFQISTPAPVETPKPQSVAQKVSNLKSLWIYLRKRYFPQRPDLDNYRVEWSNRRQKRTLASCNFEDRIVRVAKEMDHPKFHIWIEPLLYHEMCHAVLGNEVEQTSKGYAWHGKEFRALERRHPGTRSLDRWIESGGWLSAVLSARARAAHERRKRREKVRVVS